MKAMECFDSCEMRPCGPTWAYCNGDCDNCKLAIPYTASDHTERIKEWNENETHCIAMESGYLDEGSILTAINILDCEETLGGEQTSNRLRRRKCGST